MPLFYKPMQATIADKEGKKMWYPTLVKSGHIVDLQKIAEKLCKYTTVMPGEVHNVVRNLMDVMIGELHNGNSVRLDGIGTFTMKIRAKGNGVETPKEVNANQINSLRCMFTPEYTRTPQGTTRAIEQGVVFKHINTMNTGQETSSENTGGNNPGGGGNWQDPDS